MSASITIKKSAVTGKAPVAADLAYGELALNYADGLLYFKNSSNDVKYFVSGGGSTPSVGDTPPATPTSNQLWFNSIDATLYLYYNGAWVECLASNDLPLYREASTGITATAFGKYIVDCSSSAVTVTLPASPNMGDEVSIIDGTGSAATNNITVARNGNKIQGLAQNMTVNTARAAFTLVYYNSTQGWILTQV